MDEGGSVPDLWRSGCVLGVQQAAAVTRRATLTADDTRYALLSAAAVGWTGRAAEAFRTRAGELSASAAVAGRSAEQAAHDLDALAAAVASFEVGLLGGVDG